MSRIVIRVNRSDASQAVNLPHPHEFWLGPTFYGIQCYSSAARADYEYWVEWPVPFDPVRFDWLGNEYVFCLEGAGDDATAQARPARVSEAIGFGQAHGQLGVLAQTSKSFKELPCREPFIAGVVQPKCALRAVDQQPWGRVARERTGHRMSSSSEPASPSLGRAVTDSS
jgi:hypothetical protein